MARIAAYLAGLDDIADWVTATNNLVEQLGDRDHPLHYYSRERLMSSEARAGWIPPDLRSLD